MSNLYYLKIALNRRSSDYLKLSFFLHFFAILAVSHSALYDYGPVIYFFIALSFIFNYVKGCPQNKFHSLTFQENNWFLSNDQSTLYFDQCIVIFDTALSVTLNLVKEKKNKKDNFI